jgi:hypothetical protein
MMVSGWYAEPGSPHYHVDNAVEHLREALNAIASSPREAQKRLVIFI